MLGLVLTAGGARGAYQAGVLRRISEIPALARRPLPFAIVTGASAGAINGVALAARSGNFGNAALEIALLWSQLRVEQVFRSDVPSLLTTGATLARDFVLGGLFGSTLTSGFFDTSPLEAMLRNAFPHGGIADAIRRNQVYAVAVTATSYHSGRSYTFIEGRSGHPVWNKSRRVVVPGVLTYRHVLASSAIPILFPPARIDDRPDSLWFGDGALRLVAPMSPAIRLGATRILAVGVRSSRAAATLAREELAGNAALDAEGGRIASPPLAQVCGVFFNAIFLDHLDADVEHLQRMNTLLTSHMRGGDDDARDTTIEGMKPIEPLVVSPSEDLALVAQRFAHRMPRLVRYMLDGLGIPDAQSADLMSYLLFDSAFTRTLVDIGWRDADARIDEIEEFVRGADPLLAEVRQMPVRLHAVGGVE
ncbi:MAG TPA: patatin-like phospholipase family protein [Candidatus Binatia bacterium]|jgi:NTE family protein